MPGQDPPPQASAGLELEVYAVLTRSLPLAEAALVLRALGPLKREHYPDETDASLVRALRLSGQPDAGTALPLLRASLEGGQARWLEFGLHGFAIIEGRREYRPWRRNAYLGRAELAALNSIEPEVRYHAPA